MDRSRHLRSDCFTDRALAHKTQAGFQRVGRSRLARCGLLSVEPSIRGLSSPWEFLLRSVVWPVGSGARRSCVRGALLQKRDGSFGIVHHRSTWTLPWEAVLANIDADAIPGWAKQPVRDSVDYVRDTSQILTSARGEIETIASRRTGLRPAR